MKRKASEIVVGTDFNFKEYYSSHVMFEFNSYCYTSVQRCQGERLWNNGSRDVDFLFEPVIDIYFHRKTNPYAVVGHIELSELMYNTQFTYSLFINFSVGARSSGRRSRLRFAGVQRNDSRAGCEMSSTNFAPTLNMGGSTIDDHAVLRSSVLMGIPFIVLDANGELCDTDPTKKKLSSTFTLSTSYGSLASDSAYSLQRLEDEALNNLIQIDHIQEVRQLQVFKTRFLINNLVELHVQLLFNEFYLPLELAETIALMAYCLEEKNVKQVFFTKKK